MKLFHSKKDVLLPLDAFENFIGEALTDTVYIRKHFFESERFHTVIRYKNETYETSCSDSFTEIKITRMAA